MSHTDCSRQALLDVGNEIVHTAENKQAFISARFLFRVRYACTPIPASLTYTQTRALSRITVDLGFVMSCWTRDNSSYRRQFFYT